MVTFDLDAVDQAQAPGVSAPTVGGLDRDLWLHAAYHAGHAWTWTTARPASRR
jgi:formiminoglutamase